MPAERRSVGLAFLLTIGASGGTIVLSLVTGILTARFLGTDGRGHVATISAWILTFAWAASLGFANSMVYYFSKKQASKGQILSAVLLSVPILGLLGSGLAQLFVTWGFSAQSADAVEMARLLFWCIGFVIGVESLWALLMAYHAFTALNAVRVLQPLFYCLALLVLLMVDRFEPMTVLVAQCGSYAVTFALGAALLIARTRLERPTRSLLKNGAAYGLRLQGVSFGQLVTNRLDLILLPAVVSAAELGYYSIAVNVASMVMSLFGNLSMVVFPVAASSTEEGSPDVVARGLRLTLFGGFFTVLVLGVLSPWLISIVYGHDFVSATPALLWLLPGVVLWSATAVLGAALQAAGRPGRASLAQLGGMILTVIGLATLLTPYGIVGAAATSSIAYGGTFLLTLWMLHSSTEFRLREALSPAHIRDDVSWATTRIRNLARKRRSDPEEAS